MDATGAIHSMQLSLGRQAWNFARHFLEMCLAMCLVGTPLVVLLTRIWAPPISPEVTLLLVALLYTAPMVAWMRFRGMEWRPVVEMAAASFALAPVVIALAWLGLGSQSIVLELASISFCGPACAVMFVAMLPRLDLYTGRTGHHH